MRTPTSGKLVGAAVAACFLGGAAWRESSSSCVLGTTGAAASVTLQGWGSAAVCQQLAAESRSFFYERTTPVPASDVVLCEGERRGVRYVVRDQGLLMLVGRAVCGTIARERASR
jgi:hypothetical protein